MNEAQSTCVPTVTYASLRARQTCHASRYSNKCHRYKHRLLFIQATRSATVRTPLGQQVDNIPQVEKKIETTAEFTVAFNQQKPCQFQRAMVTVHKVLSNVSISLVTTAHYWNNNNNNNNLPRNQ